MHAPANTPGFKSFARTRGEVYVWIASMGLTVGLVMVLALLGIILINGITVFWPKPVALVELREGAANPPGERPFLAAEIVKKQERRGQAADAEPIFEYQFFTGNRDTYRSSFRYIDASNIVEFSYPADLAVVERMEYGDALGVPERLQLADGTELTAGNAEFEKALDRVVDEANARRREIEKIERSQIGAINAKLSQLRIDERSLQRRGVDSGAELDRITERRQALDARFQELAAEARTLRDRQRADVLTLRLPSGQERAILGGDIVHFYFPNAMSLPEKVGEFFYNFWYFLTQNPREANTEGGIFPAIFGTFVMTLLMSMAVMPFGVIAAIYLREYATQGLFVRSVRIAVNNLAGVPSIVFGVFGLGFFVYFVGGTLDSVFFSDSLPTPTFGTGGIFWASLTLALMTVPVVIVATEESLAAVPRGVREGSLACGASKWQTIQSVVLPAAAPGILTGLILAMARGAGEVAPLMLVGVVKLAPSLPIDGEFPFVHLERKFMHLGFHIFDLGFQSPDSEAARPMVFATTLLLIMLVVVLNFAAILIREHLRKKYTTSTF